MKDELKIIVESLVQAQKQIADMSTDDRMALGETLATALRQAKQLKRFELQAYQGHTWAIDAYSLLLRVDYSYDRDDDIPF